MDYTVVIDALAGHGREVGAAGADAVATMSVVRLDAADGAMPGTLSASASFALQGRFTSAADALGTALDRYVEAAQSAADGYRQQEDEATAALEAFFGRA